MTKAKAQRIAKLMRALGWIVKIQKLPLKGEWAVIARAGTELSIGIDGSGPKL